MRLTGVSERGRQNLRKMNLRPRILVGAAAALGAALTLLVSVAPAFPFAYRSPGLHIALETEAGLVALLAAYLILGRFRQDHRVRDLGVAASLAVFGVTNLFFAALPAALAAQPPGRFATWAAVAGRLLATALFAGAALAPGRKLRAVGRDLAVVGAALAVALGVIAGVIAGLAPSLPLGIDPAVTPGTGIAAAPAGHPVVAAAQLLTLMLFVVGGVCFAVQAERARDDVAAWFASGATLAAFSSFHYFLFPSLYSQWVYTGDVLRFGFYIVLLAAVVHEIGRYWRGLALLAVLEERRRVARDLHDGLAQELAFIVTKSRHLLADVEAREGLEAICTASERALDESRRAIATLSRPFDEPLALVLAQVAEEVAGRMGLRLQSELQEDLVVSPATREALLRIVREAVTNAARHGKATVARVELTNGRGLHLRVTDNGIGFDLSAVRSSGRGFGLTSIEERTRQLGGSVRIDSGPERGTSIEVVIP
jgi:signal transduction histidine kinase